MILWKENWALQLSFWWCSLNLTLSRSNKFYSCCSFTLFCELLYIFHLSNSPHLWKMSYLLHPRSDQDSSWFRLKLAPSLTTFPRWNFFILAFIHINSGLEVDIPAFRPHLWSLCVFYAWICLIINQQEMY